jgi:O-antigen/teichoic acid export membrane protein
MTTIGWWANSASDRYMVTYFCGITVNGIYSISYRIPNLVVTVQNIFIQAWGISAIKEVDSESNKSFYKNTFVYFNSLLVLCSTFIILLVKFIAKVLFAKEFYEAWLYVPVLLLSSVFNANSGYLGAIISAKKHTVLLGKSGFWGIVTNILLNLILIYYYGAQGAALATAISSYIIYFVRKKGIDIKDNGTEIKKVKISWIVLIMQSLSYVYLQNLYFNIICVIANVVIYSNEIKYMVMSLLKNLKKLQGEF